LTCRQYGYGAPNAMCDGSQSHCRSSPVAKSVTANY
jgi:hypothetical protein